VRWYKKNRSTFKRERFFICDAQQLQKQHRRKYGDGQHNQNPFSAPSLQMARVVQDDAGDCEYIKKTQ
jgi:hypothetical protein